MAIWARPTPTSQLRGLAFSSEEGGSQKNGWTRQFFLDPPYPRAANFMTPLPIPPMILWPPNTHYRNENITVKMHLFNNTLYNIVLFHTLHCILCAWKLLNNTITFVPLFYKFPPCSCPSPWSCYCCVWSDIVNRGSLRGMKPEDFAFLKVHCAIWRILFDQI